MKLRLFSCGLGHIPSSALAKARPCFSRGFDHLPCLSLARAKSGSHKALILSSEGSRR
jgi:hypothetical protein